MPVVAVLILVVVDLGMAVVVVDSKNANQDVKCLSAISETSWLWHRRLGHMHMEHLKDISSKELVRGLPKIKFEKDKVLGTPFDGYSSTYAFLFLKALVGYIDYPWMDT
ncbi:hypothetical protein RJ640_003373 [Escallonia rubra]|uniref:GAG-pre-integrase domain-containing protein n=1 Tax=Escallonia rubra TaxID=112253 RepID=A0AA88QEX8_9ASTE|nr:hypothetical protein RJ640_003373 [Escallonia rubra]